MKLTELETQLIHHITHNDYVAIHPDMTAAETEIWWWPNDLAIDMGICEKALGGVASSLVKKGLIDLAGEGTDEAVVGLTEEGFALWRGL